MYHKKTFNTFFNTDQILAGPSGWEEVYVGKDTVFLSSSFFLQFNEMELKLSETPKIYIKEVNKVINRIFS